MRKLWRKLIWHWFARDYWFLRQRIYLLRREEEKLVKLINQRAAEKMFPSIFK